MQDQNQRVSALARFLGRFDVTHFGNESKGKPVDGGAEKLADVLHAYLCATYDVAQWDAAYDMGRVEGEQLLASTSVLLACCTAAEDG